MKIEDGTGSGFLAKVNTDNRLETTAVSEDSAFEANKNGKAFFLSNNDISIGSGAPYRVFNLKNTSSTESIVIDGIVISHNGGDTNGDKIVEIGYYFEESITANNVAGTVFPLNGASSITPTVQYWVWDGVGTGMTASNGQKVHTEFFDRGLNKQPLPGKFILSSQSALTISVECVEALKCSVLVFFHLVETERDS